MMATRKLILMALLFLDIPLASAADTQIDSKFGLKPPSLTDAHPASSMDIASPDGGVHLELSLDRDISYVIRWRGTTVMSGSHLGIESEEHGDLGANPKLSKNSKRRVSRVVRPPNPLWNSAIQDDFNEISLQLASGLTVIARVADDGVAFRYEIAKVGPFTVQRENLPFHFSPQARVSSAAVDCPLDPKLPDCFHNDFERVFPTRVLTDIPIRQLTQMPLVIEDGSAWIALSEAEVFDYPGGWLRREDGGYALELPPAPKTTGIAVNDRWNYIAVTEREPYLMRAPDGRRRFPWRIIQIGASEKDLVGRDFLARLADESLSQAAQADWDWVKPGFATDEWIIDAKLGLDPRQAGFDPGLNTATYKYYVDFAAREEFPYIIIDDGWADPNDMRALNPNINLPEIVEYAARQNVRVMLWAQSSTVRKDVTAVLDLFHDLGVAGIEMDFHQRDDVEMQQFQELVVKEAASRHLLVSLHGTGKPTGLHLRYPNLITVEAGRGHEYNRGGDTVTPRHKLDLAFIRSIQGPFDYEGGSMLNVQPEKFTGRVPQVEAQGTRVNELALSLLYPSAFQVVAGDLAAYEADPLMMDYYQGLPTTWDETRVLDAKFGEFIILAKRKGRSWYLTGISALDKSMSLTLDLAFLQPGRSFEEYRDAAGSGVTAAAYDHSFQTLAPDQKVAIQFARNGGWIAKFIDEAELDH